MYGKSSILVILIIAFSNQSAQAGQLTWAFCRGQHPTVARVQGSPYFSLDENFADPDAFAKRWSVELAHDTGPAGTVSFTGDGLAIRSSSTDLPVIRTTANPFPNGDWSISFGYRCSTIGHYGAQIGCNDCNNQVVFQVHQDVSGQYVQMNGHNLITMPANSNWHVFTVVKNSQVYQAYLDGRNVGHDDVHSLPTTIVIGTGQMVNPWDFNNIDLQFVQVCKGHRIVGTEALAITSSQETAKTLPPSFVQPLPTSLTPKVAETNLRKNNENAINASMVTFHMENATAWAPYEILTFSVRNDAPYPISFWTQPIIAFSDGSTGDMTVGAISDRPFRSFSSMMNQAYSYIGVGAPSGVREINPVTSPNTLAILSETDAVIPPHSIRYFQGHSTEGNTYADIVGIGFAGNGWNGAWVDLRTQP